MRVKQYCSTGGEEDFKTTRQQDCNCKTARMQECKTTKLHGGSHDFALAVKEFALHG